MKKAQGMSLNIIIVAVIALVILVVLILSFTGKWKVFGKSTVACEGKGAGAQCLPKCADGFLTDRNTDCPSRIPNSVCCVPFMNSPTKIK